MVPLPAATAAEVGTPPVTLRLICIGLAMVKGGQLLAAFAVVLVELPFATAGAMDGLLLMTKFPQMPKAARLEQIHRQMVREDAY
jgi:hypothetical protein